MWNIVASIQHTLDEAAGLNSETTGVPRPLHDDVPKSEMPNPTATEIEDTLVTTSTLVVDEPSDVSRTAEHGDEMPCSSSLDPVTDSESLVPLESPLVAATDAVRVPPTRSATQQNAFETEIRELRSHITTLQNELQLHKRKAELADQLKEEGAELAKKVAHERERSKLILQEKKALEIQVSQQVTEIRRLEKQQRDLADAKESVSLEGVNMRERMQELETISVQQGAELERASQKIAELRSQLLAAEEQTAKNEAAWRHATDEMAADLKRQLQASLKESSQLQAQMRSASAAHELQLGSVHRELSAALNRAHVAESRLLEINCNASAAAQTLVRELEVACRELNQMKIERDQKSAELVRILKESKEAAADAASQQALLISQRESLRVEVQNLQSEVEKHLHRHERDAIRIQEVLRVNEVQSKELASLRLDVAQFRETASVCCSSTPVSSTKQEMISTNDQLLTDLLASQKAASQAHVAPRAERELARLSLEVQRLRPFESRTRELDTQLAGILHQHDVLLQMYGQLQEELALSKSAS